MSSNLTHSLFVVTGANRGFGRVIANTLAKQFQPTAHAVSFVLVGRPDEALQQVAREVESHGSNITTHVLANASLDGAVATRTTVLDRLSVLVKSMHDPPLTEVTLVNNAGSTGDLSKQASEYQAEEIQAYLDMNVVSYTTLVTGFLQLFLPTAARVTLVNISSLLAVEACANWGLYATGKAARDMLLGVISKEHDPASVRTLSYAPGPLANDMMKEICVSLGDPVQKKFYTGMLNENKLVDMGATAQKLAELLHGNNFTSGAHIDYYDL